MLWLGSVVFYCVAFGLLFLLLMSSHSHLPHVIRNVISITLSPPGSPVFTSFFLMYVSLFLFTCPSRTCVWSSVTSQSWPLLSSFLLILCPPTPIYSFTPMRTHPCASVTIRVPMYPSLCISVFWGIFPGHWPSCMSACPCVTICASSCLVFVYLRTFAPHHTHLDHPLPFTTLLAFLCAHNTSCMIFCFFHYFESVKILNILVFH